MSRLHTISLPFALVALLAPGCADGGGEHDGGFEAAPDAGGPGHSWLGSDAGAPPDGGGPSSCDDGRRDGTETGVDCGGDCPPCSGGDTCRVGADCPSGNCEDGHCAEPTCSDGLMNGAEADVDCGGGVCAPCGVGAACRGLRDCASGACDVASSTCVAVDCADGLQNGDETGVDCGGSCLACADGVSCKRDTDCRSGFCGPPDICATPTCADGIRNGDEVGIDCGGGLCPACGDGEPCFAGSDCVSDVCDLSLDACAAATCTDGVRNGDETDVDCGGATCPACGTEGRCGSPTDCVSDVCAPASMTCAAATCSDGVLNGDETDVDCGGPTCPPCGGGAVCVGGSDCEGRVCAMPASRCAVPSCTDGVRNGDETGTDCGGPTCPACDPGDGCALGSDCESGICAPSLECTASTCSDGVVNGDEVGVDCGGSCPACPIGSTCARDADCASGHCDPASESCDAPTCMDGVRNGDETGVDCGGPSCPSCGVGEGCTGAADCASGSCGASSRTCVAPSCHDGVRNGDEVGIDCGGSCPPCGIGSRCTGDSTCAGGSCVFGTCRMLESCRDILMSAPSSRSGSYTIMPSGSPALRVYCDMTTDGGGWTQVARLAAGDHPVTSIYRGGSFLTRAWIQRDTDYLLTTNSHMDLRTTLGMMDARPLLPGARDIRFSCRDNARMRTVDAIWQPTEEERIDLLESDLGGAGYATASAMMRFDHDRSGFRSVRAHPTSHPTAFWGNAQICGSGAGGGAPTGGAGSGFQLGFCHNGPTASDIGIFDANQVAIGHQPGNATLRLECGADTPAGPTEGYWTAWVR